VYLPRLTGAFCHTHWGTNNSSNTNCSRKCVWTVCRSMMPNYLALDMSQRLLCRGSAVQVHGAVAHRSSNNAAGQGHGSLGGEPESANPGGHADSAATGYPCSRPGSLRRQPRLQPLALSRERMRLRGASRRRAKPFMRPAQTNAAMQTGFPCGNLGHSGPRSLCPGKSDQCIVKAAIHPSIGIARVGNSQQEWLLAPEVTDPLPERPGFYRDSTVRSNGRRPAFVFTA
jgi:hypothetical protein